MKKIFFLLFLLALAAAGFSQNGGFNDLQIYNRMRLNGTVVNRISDDSALSQESHTSLPTEWAVINYLKNHPNIGGGADTILVLDTIHVSKCFYIDTTTIPGGQILVLDTLCLDSLLQAKGGGAINNGLKSTGGISLAGNVVTITGPTVWQINGVTYTEPADVAFTITAADSGYYRRDLIYANATGTLTKLQGTEDTLFAVTPALPAGAITVTIVDVYGSAVVQPVPLVIGVIPTWQQSMLQGNISNEPAIINYNGGQAPIQIKRDTNGPTYVYVKNPNPGVNAGAAVYLKNNYASNPYDEHSGNFLQLYMGSDSNDLVPNGGIVRSNALGGLALGADSGRIRFMHGFPYPLGNPFNEMGAFEVNGNFKLHFVDSADADVNNVMWMNPAGIVKRGHITAGGGSIDTSGLHSQIVQLQGAQLLKKDKSDSVANSGYATVYRLNKARDSVQANVATKEPIQSGTGYVKKSGTTTSYVSSIPNADLANSSITINGTPVALGASITVSGSGKDSLAQLLDVQISTPLQNQIIIYDTSGKWKNVPGVKYFFTSLRNNDLLKYDSANNQFINFRLSATAPLSYNYSTNTLSPDTTTATTGLATKDFVLKNGGSGGGVAGSNTQIQYNNSGAFGASSTFTYNPSITASGGIARAHIINPTLTAASANDTLTAVSIYPTFVTGAFGNVVKNALRVYGLITMNRNALNLDSGMNGSSNLIHQIQYDGTSDIWRFGSANGIKFINESAGISYSFTGSTLTAPGITISGAGNITASSGTVQGGSIQVGSNAFQATYPGVSATSRINSLPTGQTAWRLTTSPSALMHLGHGTQSPGLSPLKFTAGFTTTAASGTGTTATITISNPYSLTAIPIGDTIYVTGVTPTGYNGRYVVTASSGTSVSYANATTGSQTVVGNVGVLLKNPEPGATEYNGFRPYFTGADGVRGYFPLTFAGTAAPTTTPFVVGDHFIDTTNKKEYVATGTSSSSDWTILN